jgi:hypothetical protein
MRFLILTIIALALAVTPRGAGSAPDSAGMGPSGDPDTPYQVVQKVEIARAAPMRGAVRLTILLPNAAHAKLALYRVDGRRVAQRDLGLLPAGRNEVTLEETARVGAGLYIARVNADGVAAVRKIVVLP